MKNRQLWFVLYLLSVCICIAAPAYGAQDASLTKKYQEYRARLDAIATMEDISVQGFRIVENHIFPIELNMNGTVLVVPALDKQYNRMAVFLIRDDGHVLYKTDQLETNNQKKGELRQPNKGVAAISFQDVNGDGVMEILLITYCEKEYGTGAGSTYKVADVLFQAELNGKQLVYRDYRISARLNQYGMNKSIKFITTHLVQHYSTEFLYTSSTLKSLTAQGFQIYTDRSYWEDFEKWGRLRVVPGVYQMAEYYVFMVYLVNEQGYIVWSFQPMGDFESLYELKGVSCVDVDGDGLKDIVVLARYIYEETSHGDGAGNESKLSDDYAIYYQRTDGFHSGTGMKSRFRAGETDTIDDIIKKAHRYWGWN